MAPTLFAASTLTVQIPVPVHAPLQPVKVEPVLAAAVKVTLAPLLKLVLHVEPQVIPAGEELTVPLPVPLFVTVRAYVVGALVANVAVAF